MTQPLKVQEPSMEEILASIRRIIADDEAKPAGAPDSEKSATADDAPANAAAAPAGTPPPPSLLSDASALASAQIASERDGPRPGSPQPDPPKSSAMPGSPSKSEAFRAAAATARLQSGGSSARPTSAHDRDVEDIDAMLAGLDGATSPNEVRAPLPDGDVFELTDDMALPGPVPASFRKVDPPDVEFASAQEPPRPRPLTFTPQSFERHAKNAQDAPSSRVGGAPNILSNSTVSAVESAFNSLAATVLSNNARTLEDLVKEMLRPMLKNWLDDNLPGLVERIVKAEIERVSRGR